MIGNAVRLGRNNHDRLTVALFLAAVLHVFLILGVSLKLPKPKTLLKSLDIVLADNPSVKAPEKADYHAQDNQIGGGKGKKRAVPKALPEPGMAQSQPPLPVQPAPNPETAVDSKPLVTQAHSTQKVMVGEGVEDHQPTEQSHLSPETLSEQIAEVSTVWNQSQEDDALETKVVYVNSASARSYQTAAYFAAWQEKVVRIGNLNYPHDERRKNLSGSLILAVALNSDGSVKDIKLRQSSGEPALDAAAQEIVRMASPFAPFSEELRREADVLVITRTWCFSVESRMETCQ